MGLTITYNRTLQNYPKFVYDLLYRTTHVYSIHGAPRSNDKQLSPGDVHSPQRRGLLPRVLEGLFAELAAKTRAMTGEEGAEGPKSSLQISYLAPLTALCSAVGVPLVLGSTRRPPKWRHEYLVVCLNVVFVVRSFSSARCDRCASWGAHMLEVTGGIFNLEQAFLDVVSSVFHRSREKLGAMNP